MLKQFLSDDYLYTYGWHSDEKSLCQLEMRAFFGFDTNINVLFSNQRISPSRSPFMKERLQIIYRGKTVDEIVEQVKKLHIDDNPFKVISMNHYQISSTEKFKSKERQKVTREVGLAINGEPDLDYPTHRFGLVFIDETWYFGLYMKNDPVWHYHMKKPHSYSTALSTKVARALVNIAVPQTEGVRVIDPCCGIGTVLVEALSMGIDIIGRDRNPLVTIGSRKNIRHFGYKDNVMLGPIAEINENYDVAIIDLPYNLYTHITDDETFDIIKQAKRIAKKVVFVTIDPIDSMLEQAGFTIIDRGVAKKSQFIREIIVVE